MENIEAVLKEVTVSANEMVKYAEAKNAGLIAFNAAILIGMSALLKDFKDVPIILYSIIFVMSFNLLSAYVALLALVAQVKHKEIEVEMVHTDNLMYFGTVAQLRPNTLLKAIEMRYGFASSGTNMEVDLAKQAVIVSQIAVRKFNKFNVALALTFSGILTPASVAIYLVFFNPNKK
jgi:hypothetical protein